MSIYKGYSIEHSGVGDSPTNNREIFLVSNHPNFRVDVDGIDCDDPYKFDYDTYYIFNLYGYISPRGKITFTLNNRGGVPSNLAPFGYIFIEKILQGTRGIAHDRAELSVEEWNNYLHDNPSSTIQNRNS